MRQLPLPGFLSHYASLAQHWYYWYPYAISWIQFGTIVSASDIKTQKKHLIVVPIY